MYTYILYIIFSLYILYLYKKSKIRALLEELFQFDKKSILQEFTIP